MTPKILERIRVTVGIVLAAWVVVGIVGIVGLSVFVNYRLPDIPFDAASWRNGSVRERGQMVKDLRHKNMLGGMDHGQVVELLGAPDQDGHELMSYRVDLGHRFIDDPWLYDLKIAFDRKGIVKSVDVDD